MRTIRRRVAIALSASLLAMLALSSSAGAEFGVRAFDGRFDANPAGDPFSQAGGHPYSAAATIRLNTDVDPVFGREWPVEPVKDILVDLPPGLVGDASGLARCEMIALVPNFEESNMPLCPAASQVGTVGLEISLSVPEEIPPEVFPPTVVTETPLALYNMAPPPGTAARFGVNVVGVPVVLDAELRTDGEYAISLNSRNISQGTALIGSEVTFWGVPADPNHDAERYCPGAGLPGCATQAPLDLFLRMPTSCTPAGAGMLTSMRTASWWNPTGFKAASYESHEPPGFELGGAFDPSQWGPPLGTTGCEDVPFEPEVSVRPVSDYTSAGPVFDGRADSPVGLEVEIAMPQTDDPEAIGSSDLKKAVVGLPEGMAVNPASADGLGACSPGQIDLGTSAPPSCPPSSKIGTVAIDTPLLEETVSGSVYLATQNLNPFNSTLALYIAAVDAERGVVIKLPGKISPDGQTGQLEATFDDNPQLPFSSFRVSLKSGARAPLVTPATCGTYSASTELSPWARPGDEVTDTSQFTIDKGPDGGPCLAGDPSQPGSSADLAARPFGPQMNAGLINPVAASTSPFVLRLTRPDGHQELHSMAVEPPEGLSAYLRGIPLCSDAAANAGSCPAASKVGRALAGAGAGPAPFYVPDGSVFLTGPYKGAPLGMLVQVPAVAGPFDLGVVNVRAAVHVDRRTAQVRVVSDPLPQILEGIPLRVRDIRVVLDREGFTVAPTDCTEKRVLATVHGSHGGTANLSSRFQVGDCAALGFRPRLGLALKGRRQVRTGGHPAVRAVVRQGPGQAAIRAARVALPKSLALDPDNAQALCEFEDGTKPDLENHCPAGSIVGRARAHTPLLDRPLVGNVYFVKNVRIDKDTGNEIRTLPMIVTALRGQIAINLVGKSSTTKSGRLVNTFAGVPDAPIRRFNLNIRGGANGILAVTRTRRSTINLCTDGRQVANTAWRGQNGKLSRYRVRVKTPCRSAQRKRQLRLRRAAAKRRAAARRNR